MGLYDRDYTQQNYQASYGYSPRPPFHLRAPSSVVGRLLLINIAVFVLSFLIPPIGSVIYTYGSVHPVNWQTVVLQPWRVITYQFLHAGFWHIFGNMLWLYFMGPVLENLWGSRRFLIFYLVCGAAGGILYPILAFSGWLDVGIMVGASGAVLGIVAATAILFPMVNVYIYGIFPIKLVFIALIALFFSIIAVLSPDRYPNAGGEAAHLAGMATGAAYVFWPLIKTRFKLRSKAGSWQKKIAEYQRLQNEVDRILEKVHNQGIHSLTRSEKKTLKRATKLHRQQYNI
ncbi:MAG: rhomboid family intramembrane serine protease [Phycisphaerae bacterium]